jgi:hypothetical protein
MVDVVIDRPGALALLSFTAASLWELRDRRFRRLTRNAYAAMGGASAVRSASTPRPRSTYQRLATPRRRRARQARGGALDHGLGDRR